MATLNVGPGLAYTTLAAAVAAAKDGDIVALAPGTYTDDFATVSVKITIKGDGGMADLVAATQPSNGKGILIVQSDVTIQNLSFSGAKVPDLNGAGIRYEDGNLVIEDSYFHDNQNGLLASASLDGTITIIRSEFRHNGAGDGYSHNLYVNDIAALTIEDSFFHDAVVGHQIKSRAASTTITSTRVYDDSGNASYSIDLPNGGKGSISGCTIQQGAASQNGVVIHYGGESDAYPGSSLAMTDTTVVNDKTSGSVFLLKNDTTIPVEMIATDVWGLAQAQIASGGPVNQTGTTFLASRPALDSSSPWGDGDTTPPVEPPVEPLPEGVLPYPDFKKANDPGDVGRFNIQVEAAQTARHVSWGQIFAKGKVPATAVLRSTIGDNPAQMDVKTTYDDATVCHAVMTARAPKFDAAGVKKGKLYVTTGNPNPDLDFAAALDKYDVQIELGDGLQATIDLKAELLAALGDYWLQGPLATQARIDIPIQGSLRLVADVTAYNDGSFLTDLQLHNDTAMDPASATVSYSATIVADGTTVYASPPLVHHLYKVWRWVFHSSNGLPTTDSHNIQHAVEDMIAAGALLNYDLTSGIDSAFVRPVATTNIEPFSSQDIMEYMPTTGARDDIGIMPAWCGRWIKSQDITAARHALANGNVGGIPWFCRDAKTGDYLSLDHWPTLWADSRGQPALTPWTEDTRWDIDTAHTPDPYFIPYLMTGERYFLDCLNAQASYCIMATYPVPRQDGKGLVLNKSDQIRAQAWMIRTMQEAAYMNPDGTVQKTYWKKIVDNNYTELIGNGIPSYDLAAKLTAGYIIGDHGRPVEGFGYTLQPWNEDFMAEAIAAAAMRGDAKALTILSWMENWLVGRFTHESDGLKPPSGVAYQYYYTTPDRSAVLDTWAKLGAANAGPENDQWPSDGAYWVPLALATLAAIRNANGSDDARKVYDALLAENIKGTSVYDYRTQYPQYHVVPKDK